MRIKSTTIGFTDKIIIGRYGFFINISDDGIEISEKELITQAIHFKCVILYGTNIFMQKEKVAELIKGLKKKNDKIEIIIYTNGFTRPIGLSNIENIQFIIEPIMKKSGIHLNKRINYKSLDWFRTVDSKFIFDVESEDDVDEALMLSSNIDIKRSNMYFISSKNDIEKLFRYGKKYGVNISVNIDNVFKIKEELI